MYYTNVNANECLTEPHLRRALLAYLSSAPDHDDAMIFEELGVEHGTARVDVALVSNALIGYEIKSDEDSPARLFNQIHAYNRVFDRIYLAGSAQMLGELVHLVPSWWGLLEATQDKSEGLTFRLLHVAQPNPRREPLSVLSLLHKKEALSALVERAGAAISPRQNKRQLYDALTQLFTVDELSALVADSLRSRRLRGIP